MRLLIHELRLLFIATQFLTRVPIPRWVGYEPSLLNRSVRYFGAVGALVGAFGAAVALSAHALWPTPVAAVLSVAATVWLTGAFHEDGLADTSDALFGTVARERALEIMKDSRIGTYGAVALVLALLLRVSLLTTLFDRALVVAGTALIASHSLGRAAAVVLSVLLPYGGDDAHAKAKPIATRVHGGDAAFAMLCGIGFLALAIAPMPMAARLTVVAAVGVALVGVLAHARAMLRRRLGGYTGDTLGATEQVVEIGVLLVLATA